MPGKTAKLLPTAERLLNALGERLRLARLRRRLTAKQVAERAGMTVPTLRAIERGHSSVTMGAYTSVMQVLQLEGGLGLLAQDDPLGRQLQDTALEPRLQTRRSQTHAAETRTPGEPGSRTRLPASAKRRKKSTSTEFGVSSDALLELLKLGSSTQTRTPTPSKPAVSPRKSRKSTRR